jgi:hypothetical protein
VEETIYVVEEDENEEETVKVGGAQFGRPLCVIAADGRIMQDYSKTGRNAFCSR